ncbi:POT family-domain-containing protein [Obelidium mucronatum]|nr:POT family-domain-containing protein [Obelidium mucronatum]
MLYHVFTGLAYFTPLFGALISDSYLDKFNTIVALSTVYILGLMILSLTSWPTFMDVATTKLPRAGPLIGLLLICIGTGGIKPCVSAHGGDQFLEVQKLGLQKFYNYFYMTINVGALVSSYASPAVASMTLFPFPNDTLEDWAKAEIKPDAGNGYPMAWFMLALSMTAALGVFIVGKPYYRVVSPAGRFILLDHIAIGWMYGIKCLTNGKEAALKTIRTKYGDEMVEEMLDLANVLIVLAPAPVFWMAFGQNGSTWQDMGEQMLIPFGGDSKTSFFNAETTNSIWNPFFIITISPIMANYLYPWIDRRFGPEAFGLMDRMVAGQIIAGFAYILAALLQSQIYKSCTDAKSHFDDCQSSTPITYQIFLYFILTIAECLFSVSGLQFAYVEVGRRTKSFCSALWLLTTAIGSFMAAALLNTTLNSAASGAWRREGFFWLVAGLCFASAGVSYAIRRGYTPKHLRVKLEDL